MLSEQHDYVVGKLKRQQGFFKFIKKSFIKYIETQFNLKTKQ